MKVTISFLPAEFRRAFQIREVVTALLPGAKIRESDKHAPYKQIYITTKRPAEKE